MLRRAGRHVLSDRLQVASAGISFFAVLSIAPAAGDGAVGLRRGQHPRAGAGADVQRRAPGCRPSSSRWWPISSPRITAASTEVNTFRGLTGLVFALWTATTAATYLIDALTHAYHETETRGFLHRTGLALTVVLGGAVAAGRGDLGGRPRRPGGRRRAGAGPAAGRRARVAGAGRASWRRGSPCSTASPLTAPRPGGGGSAAAPRSRPCSGWPPRSRCSPTCRASAATSRPTAPWPAWRSACSGSGSRVFLVILGASVNAEAERQTVRDSTVGPEQPLGRRGAVVADSAPPSPGEDVAPGTPATRPGEFRTPQIRLERVATDKRNVTAASGGQVDWRRRTRAFRPIPSRDRGDPPGRRGEHRRDRDPLLRAPVRRAPRTARRHLQPRQPGGEDPADGPGRVGGRLRQLPGEGARAAARAPARPASRTSTRRSASPRPSTTSSTTTCSGRSSTCSATP